MNVTLIARTPCHVCGHENKTINFAQVRVNKRSLRTTGPSLIFGERSCEECCARLPSVGCDGPTRWRIDADDEQRVAEYRARRFGVAS